MTDHQAWTQDIMDDIHHVLSDHYFVMYALEVVPADEGDTRTILFVTLEDPHIDRHITFDASSRKLPDDFRIKDSPAGPGSVSAQWAQEKAPEYDGYTWDEGKHGELVHDIHAVLDRHGDDTAFDVEYVPLTPRRVLERLLAMKARHHSWSTSSTTTPSPSNSGTTDGIQTPL